MAEANGFDYRASSDGTVRISHHGRFVTALRGGKAAAFLAKAKDMDADQKQQAMARLTGNYKRGNERAAKGHQRNG